MEPWLAWAVRRNSSSCSANGRASGSCIQPRRTGSRSPPISNPRARSDGCGRSRAALTYRSLDQLAIRGLVHAVGEEPGIAGGNRTILAATRSGRAQLRRWLATPVAHLRDLRSELLLKLVIAERCHIDVADMLALQRVQIVELCRAIDEHVAAEPDDVVTLWRSESSHAALRFLDRLPTH